MKVLTLDAGYQKTTSYQLSTSLVSKSDFKVRNVSSSLSYLLDRHGLFEGMTFRFPKLPMEEEHVTKLITLAGGRCVSEGKADYEVPAEERVGRSSVDNILLFHSELIDKSICNHQILAYEIPQNEIAPKLLKIMETERWSIPDLAQFCGTYKTSLRDFLGGDRYPRIIFRAEYALKVYMAGSLLMYYSHCKKKELRESKNSTRKKMKTD